MLNTVFSVWGCGVLLVCLACYYEKFKYFIVLFFNSVPALVLKVSVGHKIWAPRSRLVYYSNLDLKLQTDSESYHHKNSGNLWEWMMLT